MQKKYGGMTVNERLYVSGLMEKFEHAVNEGNTSLIVSILEDVELTEANIIPILENLGLKKE